MPQETNEEKLRREGRIFTDRSREEELKAEQPENRRASQLRVGAERSELTRLNTEEENIEDEIIEEDPDLQEKPENELPPDEDGPVAEDVKDLSDEAPAEEKHAGRRERAAIPPEPKRDGKSASPEKKEPADASAKKKDGEVLDAESAKKRIKAVEDQGLAKIENGLKNYNTKDLMEGLCEVLASRSAKAHQDELKPQEIQRSLSPECISRVRNHFGKKLEAALKSIDKDEFMDIMNSDNIGERMAEKVNKNLVENENHPAPDKRIEDKKIAARQLESKKKSVLPS